MKFEDEEEEEQESPLDEYGEAIGEDVANAFNAWIRPQLAAFIGWPAVNAIRDREGIEGLLAANTKQLFIKLAGNKSKAGISFVFRLCQGIESPGKFKVVARLRYDVDYATYKERFKHER